MIETEVRRDIEAYRRQFNQNPKKLERIRQMVSRYRKGRDDIESVVATIGFNPNLTLLQPYLGRENPVEIARKHQKILSQNGSKVDANTVFQSSLDEKAKKWKCDTSKFPKKWAKFDAFFEVRFPDDDLKPYIIAMIATENEFQRFSKFSEKLHDKYVDDLELDLGDRDDLFESFIGFGKATPYEDILLVNTLRTAFFSVKVPGRWSHYHYWDRVWLTGTEHFASFMGFKEIWVTPADYQLRRWEEIQAATAWSVYALTPFRMGYTLRATNYDQYIDTGCNLVWAKTKKNKDINEISCKSGR